MCQLTDESDENEGYILIAKMDNARNLTNVLKAIHFRDVGCGWYTHHSQVQT